MSSKISTIMTDPISDMFIRIKNANAAGRETVYIPYSRLKHEMAKVLSQKGFVGEIEVKGKRVRKSLEVALLYKEGKPSVENVRLISTPSRRLYRSYRELRNSVHGGILLLTTPKGILTERDAKKEKVGGELIVEIW